MSIKFSKYQGTGNDFILINNFDGKFPVNDAQLIQRMCDRKFGIGADGLMILQPVDGADFELLFFNPDASVSFCGNGSRCAVLFAKDNGLIKKDKVHFKAFDGMHDASRIENIISISMRDVSDFVTDSNGTFVNTGAPHVVVVKDQLETVNIVEEGKKIRYDQKYAPIGTNVNFIQPIKGGIEIRTYEKGVENETLSCGTGVTASALVFASTQKNSDSVKVKVLGGDLEVSFTRKGEGFTNVRLTGPAQFVFEGIYHE